MGLEAEAEILIVTQSSVNVGIVIYKVLKSNNAYTGTFNVIII